MPTDLKISLALFPQRISDGGPDASDGYPALGRDDDDKQLSPGRAILLPGRPYSTVPFEGSV